MAVPGKRFSFMRLINNAVPNFAKDDPNDVDLSSKEADDLVTYQLVLPHPRHLSENAFYVAGIVGSKSLSKQVYKALVKNKLIFPVPEDGSGSGAGGEVQMTVNTAGVTKSFASQMAVISVHAQRQLVGMLFFWEEKCMRWKLLDEEEREILKALETGENADLAVALEAVEIKKKLLPSHRAESTADVGLGHQLPPYA
jgi:hypothetical protein